MGYGQGSEGHRLRHSEPHSSPGTLPSRLEGAGWEPEVVRDLLSAAAAVEENAAMFKLEGKVLGLLSCPNGPDPKPGVKGAEWDRSWELATLTGQKGPLSPLGVPFSSSTRPDVSC